MVEAIETAIAELAVQKLVSQGYKEIKSAVDLESDVKKLQDTRTVIQAAILDADSIPQHSHVKQAVLKMLRYELDRLTHLLHTRETRGRRKAVVCRNRFLGEARLFFSASNPVIARFRDAQKVKAIKKKLGSIREDAMFGSIISQLPSASQSREGSVLRVGTVESPHIETSGIVGRDGDRDNIISLLTDKSRAEETFSVVSIVGISGLGKTALARYVYNDARVKCCFDIQAWVPETWNFNSKEVVEKIIACGVGGKPPSYSDKNQLYDYFVTAFRGKKFLLVLDNVRDHSCLMQEWIDMTSLLAFGAKGSIVLLITRYKRVCNVMCSDFTYMLGDLTEEASWLLFQQTAFTEEQDPKVETIGKEIVNMCPKVPLVIKIIGGLLAGKYTLHEWNAFKGDLLEIYSSYGCNVIQILGCCYDQLNERLKRCLAYCSAYPKGFKHNKDEIVRTWIHLGFVEPQYKTQSLEEAAEAYIHTLVNYGIFRTADLYLITVDDIVHGLLLSNAEYKYRLLDSDSDESSELVYQGRKKKMLDRSREKKREIFSPLPKKPLIKALKSPSVKSIKFSKITQSGPNSYPSMENPSQSHICSTKPPPYFDSALESFIPITEPELLSLSAPWSSSLIVTIIGRPFSVDFLCESLEKLWHPSRLLDFIALGSNFYNVSASVASDRDKILAGGPWFLLDHYVHIQPWEPGFTPSKAKVTTAPVWLSLPELPIEFHSLEFLSKVGNSLGSYVKADITTDKNKMRTVKLLVLMDLSIPFKNSVWIGYFNQPIHYVVVPEFCKHCQIVKYPTHACPTSSNSMVNMRGENLI